MIENIKNNIQHWAKNYCLPDIYYQLCDLLQIPETSMADIALLFSREQEVSKHLLAIVNTPLHRHPVKISSVSQVISLMGAEQLKDLALCASLLWTFNGIPKQETGVHEFWQRAVYCAVTARQLAIECAYSDSERMFTLALLLDIGHLFLIDQYPDEIRAIQLDAVRLGRPAYLIEQETFGVNHTEIAAQIMKIWNLPRELRTPVTNYLEPEKAHKYDKEASMLHLASLLSQYDLEEGIFDKNNQERQSIDKLTRLLGNCCQQIKAVSKETHETIINQLFNSKNQSRV